MEPKSLSASALNVANLCLSRYAAEYINRGSGISNSAALLGTSVHGALEMYVKVVYLDRTAGRDLKYLLDLFKLSYMQTFGTTECVGDDYEDGVEMLKRWYKRADLEQEDREVISVEVKKNFPIKTSIGDIPFNYILDRFDKTGEGIYRVVDYKTNRWGINPADLHKKIQPRAYALAMAIELKDEAPDRIYVEFDMLRHEGPVGTLFTRADNTDTWRFLRAKAQQIIDTPEENAPETLNPECNFCPRKLSCQSLTKNISIGGVFSLSDQAEIVDKRAELAYQKAAVARALDELDAIILGGAKAEDVMSLESSTHVLNVGVRTTRAIDAAMAEHVIGPELMNKYGGKSFTIKSAEALVKGDELTAAQRKQLVGLIYQKKGEPSVSTKPKNPITSD